MKTLVHVNQHVIKANKKHGEVKPPLTVKTYKSGQLGSTVILRKDGIEVGRFVYSPDKPLSCGAHVWFETKSLELEVL